MDRIVVSRRLGGQLGGIGGGAWKDPAPAFPGMPGERRPAGG